MVEEILISQKHGKCGKSGVEIRRSFFRRQRLLKIESTDDLNNPHKDKNLKNPLP